MAASEQASHRQFNLVIFIQHNRVELIQYRAKELADLFNLYRILCHLILSTLLSHAAVFAASRLLISNVIEFTGFVRVDQDADRYIPPLETDITAWNMEKYTYPTKPPTINIIAGSIMAAMNFTFAPSSFW